MACSAQEQKDWSWVNDHFPDVLEEVMPIQERLGFSLGYRSYRDLYRDELESSFVFSRILQEKYITVVLREADSVSIYDQIMALHTKNPGESIEAIKKQLRVKELGFSEQTYPAVRRQYDRFYELRLPMLSGKDRAAEARGVYIFTLHPRVHTFRADVSGGSMRLVIAEQDHPFVVWAKATLAALKDCAPPASETGKQKDEH
jgi:hypothetical protein